MVDWLSIILLVIVGLVLIYLELIFVPGTTILGIIGFVMTVIGIYIAYDKYGNTTGSLVLAGSLLTSVVALVYSFKSRSWDRFALKQKNTGKVNEGYVSDLQLGMEGVALSDLKPIGKAEFNDRTYEVTSLGNLIEAGKEILISRISKNKIIVEPK